jgi:hypothetical protein
MLTISEHHLTSQVSAPMVKFKQLVDTVDVAR